MSRRIYVQNTDNARRYGLGGQAGYVESQREDGTLRVCVYDLDGGLAGPFNLTEADVLDIEMKSGGEVIEPRDPSTLSAETRQRIADGVAKYCGRPQESETKIARRLGGQAFTDGKQCVPALDPSVMELLKGKQVGEGIPVLDAWLAGWTAANLETMDSEFAAEIREAFAPSSSLYECHTVEELMVDYTEMRQERDLGATLHHWIDVQLSVEDAFGTPSEMILEMVGRLNVLLQSRGLRELKKGKEQ